MTDQQFINYWFIGLGIIALIVVVVAALVLTLIFTARSIWSNAKKAIAVANQIVENTDPIWELDKTNAVAVQLLEGARAIEKHTNQIADTLEAPAQPVTPPF